jgi:hypothetical protein
MQDPGIWRFILPRQNKPCFTALRRSVNLLSFWRCDEPGPPCSLPAAAAETSTSTAKAPKMARYCSPLPDRGFLGFLHALIDLATRKHQRKSREFALSRRSLEGSGLSRCCRLRPNRDVSKFLWNCRFFGGTFLMRLGWTTNFVRPHTRPHCQAPYLDHDRIGAIRSTVR